MHRFAVARVVAALLLAAPAPPAWAQSAQASCRLDGVVASAGTPLPGVAIIVRDGETTAAVTSTGIDGRYELVLTPGTYVVNAELTGFARGEQSTTMGCGQRVDFSLTLAPRTAAATPAPAAPVQGFERLNLQRRAAIEAPSADGEADVPQLALPQGFSLEAADAVAVNGNSGAFNRLDPDEGSGPQRVFTLNSGYTLGGSALDASPYQLRPNNSRPDPDYLRQTVDLNIGGPLVIPRLYDGTGKTTFSLSYSRNQGDTLFDQYATVPSAAMRAGDFSTLGRAIVDPATGQPFEGNVIPAPRIDSSARALLRFIPEPNLPGTSRNFRHVATSDTAADNVTLRLTHNFTPSAGAPAGRGGGRGGFAGGARGGGGPRGGGPRGRAGGGPAGITASLNSQVQYRSNDGDRHDVFPALSGTTTGYRLSVPTRLNITHRRTQHSINVDVSRTQSETRNQYAFVEDVAAAAGIRGVATDPFAWGVPELSFASLSSVTDQTPSVRADTRLTLGYSWSRPVARHQFRAGAEFRRDVASSRTDSNARGTYVFTGLYSGSDFADFLLGTPQQASVHYGPGDVSLHGRSISLFVQDNWRQSARLTFNMGLRYELTFPLVEGHGRLVNLDASPDFSSVAPVAAGRTGPFSGALPDGLVHTDVNNLAPRLGVAWRAGRATVLRGGYGVSFNAGTYGQIARQLASQPPFAVTDTAIGDEAEPLSLSHAFAAAAAAATTNNFGVAPDYQVGRVQTWNVDLNHEIARGWSAGAGYTFAVGSSLDLVRAPNRGPDGLRVPDIQPFLWQTSESSSRLHSATFRLRRRNARGIGGGLSYTLARSRDNASTIGGGGTVVAQDDRDLDAEWGLSSFDRRHEIRGNLRYDLPFGPDRRWVTNSGLWTQLLQMWTVNVNVRVQAGTPLTARVLSAASDAARGTNGTLRADYTGAPVALDEPTIDRFFNTAAFALPSSGTFGTAGRNLIIGPGSKDLSATLTRDVGLGGSRTLTLQLRANNLLNLVNYAAVNTVVNSPSFGQVTSVRPMRSVQLTLRFTY